MKFIISGHGNYATGLKSAIECIAGNNENFKYIDFTVNTSSEELRTKFIEEINKDSNEKIVFICDLVGATPFNISSVLSIEYPNIKVVAGVNLSAILEVMFETIDDVEYIKSKLIKTTTDTALSYERRVVVNEKKSIGI